MSDDKAAPLAGAADSTNKLVIFWMEVTMWPTASEKWHEKDKVKVDTGVPWYEDETWQGELYSAVAHALAGYDGINIVAINEVCHNVTEHIRNTVR